PRHRGFGSPASAPRAGRPPLARGQAGARARHGSGPGADGPAPGRADGRSHARRAGRDRKRPSPAGRGSSALYPPDRARSRLRPRDQYAAGRAPHGAGPPRRAAGPGSRLRPDPDDLRRGTDAGVTAPSVEQPALAIGAMRGGYGESPVLRGVSLAV